MIIAAMTAIYAKLISKKKSTPELTEESITDPEPSESEMVSLREAQEILGVSRTTMWRLRKNGVLQSHNLDNTIKINRQSLTKHLNK